MTAVWAAKRTMSTHEPAHIQEQEAKGSKLGVNEQAEEDVPQQEDFLSDYARMRRQLIQRNRERLHAMGFPDAVQGLNALVVKAKPKSRRAAGGGTAKREAAKGEEEEKGQAPKEEEDQELTKFIVDGECPKCGRVVSRGHRQHLAQCGGFVTADPIVLTEEELKVQADLMRHKENRKLKELEFEGLVDFTPDSAVFCVLGAGGTPYRVTLSDEGRMCQCTDQRVRKHDCKHIQLILQSLGIQDDPSKWRQAVERHFKSAGGAAAGAATEGAAAPQTPAVEAAASAAATAAATSAPRGGRGSASAARGRATRPSVGRKRGPTKGTQGTGAGPEVKKVKKGEEGEGKEEEEEGGAKEGKEAAGGKDEGEEGETGMGAAEPEGGGEGEGEEEGQGEEEMGEGEGEGEEFVEEGAEGAAAEEEDEE